MKLYGGRVGDDAVSQDHTFDKALHVQHIASVKAVGAFQPTALVHLSGWEIPLPGWVQGSAICSTRYPTTKNGSGYRITMALVRLELCAGKLEYTALRVQGTGNRPWLLGVEIRSASFHPGSP